MAGEKTTSAPNFFLLLGLNPADPWDEKKFEQALEAKRSEWARKSSMVGNVAMEARRNLALYGEIQRAMRDPDERSAQAAAARKEYEAGRQARLEQFERQVEIASGKGFLEQAELDRFIADFKDVLSEKEIRERIKAPIQALNTQGPGVQQLDPTTVKEINDHLHFLQKSDLYDLLNMPDMTSNQELSRAAQELYEEMQRRQPKTAEVTTASSLAGHARIIFKTDEMRRKYNESRRLSKLNTLLEEFEETVNRSSGKQKGLYAKQVALFLERATRNGWSQEEARLRLQEYANRRHWFLEVPTLEITTGQQRCGYCKAFNPQGREFCKECNKALRVHCPDCGQVVRSDEVGCGNCGFPVGNRYRVDELLADCRDLLAKQQVEAADRQLKHAEEIWAPKRADSLRQQIQACRTQIQSLMQTRKESSRHIEDLLLKRQFFAAHAYLLQPQAGGLPDRERYARTIADAIAQAEALLKRAKTLSAVEQKTDLCLQALHMCTDYKEAHDLLSTLPPSPPRNLQARVGGSTISLQWDASPTRSAGYRIVRKIGSQPVSVGDGQTLATVAGRVYEDTHPEVGVPVFYAIFAVLADIPSLDGALLPRPVMLLQDVTDLKTRVDSQFVEISWQAPPHVTNILVERQEQLSQNAVGGKTFLATLDLHHVLDRAVENEHVYIYTIYCQFKAYNGQFVNSAGVTVKARPEAPPALISSLDITSRRVAQGYEVQLSWTAPQKGRAVILKSVNAPQIKGGETLASSELGRYGKILEERADLCRDLWTQPGVACYTPIVIFQGTAYAGSPERFVVIDDVRDLRYQNLGSAIRLNWTWPANCQEVIVAYDYEQWPQTDHLTRTSQRVTLVEYEHKGYYDLKGVPDRDHYIVVAAIVAQGDERIVGAGARVRARLVSKLVVTYEIKDLRPLFGPKKRMLRVTARSAGTLPTILVMSKQGRLPLRKEEGEILFRQEGPLPIETTLEFELPERTFAPRTFGKLYLEDDTLYESVTIHHPDEEKLRLA